MPLRSNWKFEGGSMIVEDELLELQNSVQNLNIQMSEIKNKSANIGGDRLLECEQSKSPKEKIELILKRLNRNKSN